MISTVYPEKKLKKLRFPLGGIGTGAVLLSGGGSPSLYGLFGKEERRFCHFALRADTPDGKTHIRLLNTCADEANGAPAFDPTPFRVRFPYAFLRFSARGFPGKVELCAFNPFLPVNHIDSSIPAAFFEFELQNTENVPINYALCAAAENPLARGVNRFDGDIRCDMKALCFGSRDDRLDDGALQSFYNAKGMCIATDCDEASYREYLPLPSGRENDPNVLLEALSVMPLDSTCEKDPPEGRFAGLMAAHVRLMPGEKRTVRFVLAHYMRHAASFKSEKRLPNNFYCRFFSSAKDCAAYCFLEWSRLKNDTDRFTCALYESTLPETVLESSAASIAAAKSPLLTRAGDKMLCDVRTLSPLFLPEKTVFSALYPSSLWAIQKPQNEAKSGYLAAAELYRAGADEEAGELLSMLRSLCDGESGDPFGEAGELPTDLLSGYGLLSEFCGIRYTAEKQELCFEPLLRFTDREGYYKCVFGVGSAYGTLEAGPKYVEMKILWGEVSVRRFGIFSEPKVFYYGGRKLDFHAEGNIAVLDFYVKCTPEKGITVIYD